MPRSRSPFNNGSLLSYPLNKLRDSDDWVKINIVEYTPGSFSDGSSGRAFATTPAKGGNLLATISLPMPWNLPTNSVATPWGATEMSPLAARLGDLTNGIIQDPSTGLDQVQSAIKDTYKTATSGLGQQAIETGFTTLVINQIIGGSSIQDILPRFTGIRFNNNVELTFGGVALREPYVLSFDMTPREQRESDAIRNIIRTLKYHSTPDDNPQGGNGAFLKAPDLFVVEYMKGGRPHPYLNKFKLSALTSLSASINPDGYATYDDGTPIKIRLDLSFQELTPIYRRDYVQVDPSTIGY